MKIVVIGAGFTGLVAGLKVQEKGHQVTIFDKDSLPGVLRLALRIQNGNGVLKNTIITGLPMMIKS